MTRKRRRLVLIGGALCVLAVAVGLMLTKNDPYLGLNAGFIALCCNFAVTVAVTLLSPEEQKGAEELLVDRPAMVEGTAVS